MHTEPGSPWLLILRATFAGAGYVTRTDLRSVRYEYDYNEEGQVNDQLEIKHHQSGFNDTGFLFYADTEILLLSECEPREVLPSRKGPHQYATATIKWSY